MSSKKRKPLFAVVLLAAVVMVAAAGFVWSGVYDVGADAPHTRLVGGLLETVRERSIQARASSLQVPDLRDPARVLQGSGNYQAMCTGCHLAPGMDATELSQGLYPAPPNLTKHATPPAEAFWVIKHGIKASGMPAWGKSMPDEYIWNMAAFLQELPKLSPEQYKAMVAQSGGHSHGGGESMPPSSGAKDKGADKDAEGVGESDTGHDADPHHDATPHSHAPAKTGPAPATEEKAASPPPHKDHADDGHQH